MPESLQGKQEIRVAVNSSSVFGDLPPRFRSPWHPVFPPIHPPSSKLLSGLFYHGLGQSILQIQTASSVFMNYICSQPKSQFMKDDALLFMLHLHTCIVNSIFLSDNKSMAPRGSRWREACVHFPSNVLRPLVDDWPG